MLRIDKVLKLKKTLMIATVCGGIFLGATYGLAMDITSDHFLTIDGSRWVVTNPSVISASGVYGVAKFNFGLSGGEWYTELASVEKGSGDFVAEIDLTMTGNRVSSPLGLGIVTDNGDQAWVNVSFVDATHWKHESDITIGGVSYKSSLIAPNRYSILKIERAGNVITTYSTLAGTGYTLLGTKSGFDTSDVQAQIGGWRGAGITGGPVWEINSFLFTTYDVRDITSDHFLTIDGSRWVVTNPAVISASGVYGVAKFNFGLSGGEWYTELASVEKGSGDFVAEIDLTMTGNRVSSPLGLGIVTDNGDQAWVNVSFVNTTQWKHESDITIGGVQYKNSLIAPKGYSILRIERVGNVITTYSTLAGTGYTRLGTMSGFDTSDVQAQIGGWRGAGITGGPKWEINSFLFTTYAMPIDNAFVTPKKINVKRQSEHSFQIHIQSSRELNVYTGNPADVEVDGVKYPAVVSGTDMDGAAKDIAVKVYMGDAIEGVNDSPQVAIYSINGVRIQYSGGADVDDLSIDIFTPRQE